MKHTAKHGMIYSCLTAILLCAQISPAEVKMAAVFGENMVLQRGMPVPIWGTADKGEKVTLKFHDQELAATAGDDGKWKVSLAKMDAGGPWPMTVEGSQSKRKIEYKEVFVGDVWLCAGQSNMWFPVESAVGGKEAVLEEFDGLHLFRGGGRWWKPGKGRTDGFSAVGFWFGKAIAETRKIHVGLISSTKGATGIESWMLPETLAALGKQAEADKFKNDIYALYHGIKDLQPFAIKGAIWYQGESNVNAWQEYQQLLDAMIKEWRANWGQGDFPFLIVQLQRVTGDAKAPEKIQVFPEHGLSCFRVMQTKCLAIPNTGMIVTFDLTNGDLHPPDKKAIADRLALLARGAVYGEKIACRSPLQNSIKRDGDRVIIGFSDTDDGLTAKDAEDGGVKDVFLVHPLPKSDNKWAPRFKTRPATARVEGKTVVVDIKDIEEPVSVYYCINAYPMGNLYDRKSDLPVSPFIVEVPEKK